MNSDARRLLVVSPCRDEEATLPATIRCMVAQTRPPDRWIVVDDGSTDRTPEILARAAADIPWLRVVRRADRGFRELGRGVIECFRAGLAAADIEYDLVAKLDVDLEFSARYIETALEHLEADPKLAAVSGKVYRQEHGHLVEEFMIDEMVAGQFKLYRRSALEAIGGFVQGPMWDGIDFHRARICGYRTASIDEPDLRIVHLRMMGSSDRSVYRGRVRHGHGQWFMGSSAAYVVASGLFRMLERPYVSGGLLMIWGYLVAALRREPRYPDPSFRRAVRSWQYRRLARLLQGRGAR